MKAISILAAAAMLLAACNQSQPQQAQLLSSPTSGPTFIPSDSANKMIQSYLTSTTGNPDDLRALILDADSMKSYLTDTSIRHLKVMLAHTLNYINDGNNGRP